MLDCNAKVFNTCNVAVCWGQKATVELPAIATATETYTIEYEYLNSKVETEVEIEQGEKVVFAANLNENQCYNFTVKNEEGQIITYEKEGTTYSCFRVCTVLSVGDC